MKEMGKCPDGSPLFGGEKDEFSGKMEIEFVNKPGNEEQAKKLMMAAGRILQEMENIEAVKVELRIEPYYIDGMLKPGTIEPLEFSKAIIKVY